MLTTRVAREVDAAAVARLWTAGNTARQAEVGLPLGPVAGAGIAEAEQQVHLRLADPASFALLVEDDGDLVAMALVLQALAQDGASRDPLPGLAHVSMVVVRPDRWGQGLGALVLDLAQLDARKRGFTRAQLWTHETNDALSGSMNALVGWRRDEGRPTTTASGFGTTFANCEHAPRCRDVRTCRDPCGVAEAAVGRGAEKPRYARKCRRDEAIPDHRLAKADELVTLA